MHSGDDFVERIIEDPTVSLKESEEDRWGYPVPVSPLVKGRPLLANYAIVRTDMRKLYQPNHDRFYTVAVEVFCDRPGLPRAGTHDDFEVGFVMRRIAVRYSDEHGCSVRKLAAKLMREEAVRLRLQPDAVAAKNMRVEADIRDLWWSDDAVKAFNAENGDMIAAAGPRVAREAWVQLPGGARWIVASDDGLTAGEQTSPMWKLPKREKDCPAVESRSLWFGVVPTFSSEHGVDMLGKQKGPEPKLDDHGIYELVCFVKLKPKPGHEHCPPQIFLSAASQPFRLASPMDPEGTKNRVVSITLPDFRAMAARTADKRGPGGVRIITPPRSQMMVNPFIDKMPTASDAKIGIGGGVCTFAFELFFIVAFFLFLLFMPIVVLAFQLWWMLALRFCIPPSVSFDALATAAAEGKLKGDAKLEFDVDVVFGAAWRSFDEKGNPIKDRIGPPPNGTDMWYPGTREGPECNARSRCCTRGDHREGRPCRCRSTREDREHAHSARPPM